MGMSASQVRFLSLQNRKHTIGRELSTLSNRKMALSRDMNKVSKNYTEALNQINLKWSSDSGATYQNLTYDLMMRPNELNTETPYIITNAKNGRVVLNNDTIKATAVCKDPNSNENLSTDSNGNVLARTTINDANGNPIITAGQPISYVSIAKLISNFSTVNDYSELEFNKNGVHTGTDGITYGDKSADNAYYIPNALNDYSFDNTLRYEIFRQLGLVTDSQIKQQENYFIQLYGSKEAQETGIYPVGSAMGDYYIALANKEAYEEFLATRQSVASGATFDNTRRLVGNYTSLSENYAYSSTVYGTGDAHSVITQKAPVATNAASHVNFRAVVYTESNGDSDIAYKNDSATSAAYNTHFSNYTNVYSNNNVSNIYKNINITMDETGLTYKYDIEDVLQSTGSEAYNYLTDGDGGNDHRILVDNDGTRINWEGATNELRSICSSMMSFIKTNNTIDNISDTAYSNAITATVKHFFENIVEYNEGCWYQDPGSTHAQGLNVIWEDYQEAHNHWSLWSVCKHHKHHEQTSIDTRAVWNVFMTNLHKYQGEGVASPVEFDTSTIVGTQIPTITHNILGEPSVSPSDAIVRNFGGHLYVDFISNDSSAKSIEVTRAQLKNSNDGNDIGVKIIQYQYKNNSTGAVTTAYSSVCCDESVQNTNPRGSNYRNISSSDTPVPSGCTLVAGSAQYVSKYIDAVPDHDGTPVPNSNEFTYRYAGSSTGTVANPETINVPGKGNCPVFATARNGNLFYYFLDSSAAQAWVNGTASLPTTSTSSVYIYDITSGSASSGSSSVISAPADQTGDSHPTEIVYSMSDSYYDIRLEGYVKESTDYSDYLDQKVKEAEQRIENIKFALDNFYSGADKKIMDYYDALFLKIAESGWEVDEKTGDKNAHGAEYLNGMLQNNMYFVTTCREKADSTGYQYTTQIASNVKKIFQVHDSNAENQALAVYESDKTLIQSKEKKIDARMRKLETEQEAINTEMDGIQKVISENIEKTFKIFA